MAVKKATLKTWSWMHKWSSLICTLFMLLLCLTGLPLVFHEDINRLLGTAVNAPEIARDDASRASMDQVVAVAQAQYPERVVQFVSQSDDSANLWFVTLSSTLARSADFRSVVIDARTGEIVAQPRFDQGFMWVMFKLHVDLFAGLPGKLFLGFMGLLLLISIISGVVLYAPFMRNLNFGAVRRYRRPRLKWLDLHNLIGIVTLVWLSVVSATGVVNTWADLVTRYWQHDQLSALVDSYKDLPVVSIGDRGSLEEAMNKALQAVPESKVSFIAFPGTDFSSSHHITFFLQGAEPLTAKLLQPVLVDAKSSEVSAIPELPWYLSVLLLSQPLHFGDYGGRAMQVFWALLDIASIVLLGSGLYLWLKKRRASKNKNEFNL